MDTQNSTPPAVVQEAERIVYLAKWRLFEQEARLDLAGTHAVATTPLFPDSSVIHFVAIDGVVVGRVCHHGRRWVAVHPDTTAVAIRFTFRGAVRALVRAARQ